MLVNGWYKEVIEYLERLEQIMAHRLCKNECYLVSKCCEAVVFVTKELIFVATIY